MSGFRELFAGSLTPLQETCSSGLIHVQFPLHSFLSLLPNKKTASHVSLDHLTSSHVSYTNTAILDASLLILAQACAEHQATRGEAELTSALVVILL